MLKQRDIGFIVAGVLLGVILTFVGMTLMNRVQPAPIAILPPPTPEPTATAAPLRVYVNGAVAQAAVYVLPPGSIVGDAVAMAGGFTGDAYTAVVNLAQPLQEGMQVYVPSLAEREAGVVPVVAPVVAVDTAVSGSAAATGSDGLININTASLAELDELPGIGPSTAQKILDYRDSNGPFAAIENIMDVSGIGEAKFEQIQELITVGDN